jgi:hypothetical protein
MYVRHKSASARRAWELACLRSAGHRQQDLQVWCVRNTEAFDLRTAAQPIAGKPAPTPSGQNQKRMCPTPIRSWPGIWAGSKACMPDTNPLRPEGIWAGLKARISDTNPLRPEGRGSWLACDLPGTGSKTSKCGVSGIPRRLISGLLRSPSQASQFPRPPGRSKSAYVRLQSAFC